MLYLRTEVVVRLVYLSVSNHLHISLLFSFHRLEDINGALSADHHVTCCYFAARNFLLCDEQQKY